MCGSLGNLVLAFRMRSLVNNAEVKHSHDDSKSTIASKKWMQLHIFS